jgi:hypothetical protein
MRVRNTRASGPGDGTMQIATLSVSSHTEGGMMACVSGSMRTTLCWLNETKCDELQTSHKGSHESFL